MERDNRKSHLAPQLSPGTQELLRSNNSPDGATDDRALETPTSGEIPIVGAIIQSPRDQLNSVSNRSPTRSDRGAGGSSSAGRPNGPPSHPGLGPRVATTNSIPKMAPPPPPRPGRHSPNLSASSNSSKQTTFALPLRPPPGGPLPAPPPPPARRQTPQTPQTPDEASNSTTGSRGIRRQATFGLPQGTMSAQGMGMGFPANQVRRE